MQAERGHRVLDLGCGPGTDTLALALAERVGSDGMVVGIDRDPAMVRELSAGQWRRASEPASSITWPTPPACRCGPTHSTRAARSGSFSTCPIPPPRSENSCALPGGAGGSWSWTRTGAHCPYYSPEIEIERRLTRVHADHLLHNGYAGRQLHQLFRRQGVADLRVAVYPVYAVDLAQVRLLTVLDEVERKAIDLGVVTQAELRRWHASLQALEAEGGVFCTATLIMVAGRKA